MDKKLTYAIIVISLLVAVMAFSGCGYKGSLLIKDNEVIAKSNKPMEINRVIDKDGNTSVTYSSKKNASWMENLLTLVGLKAVNK